MIRVPALVPPTLPLLLRSQVFNLLVLATVLYSRCGNGDCRAGGALPRLSQSPPYIHYTEGFSLQSDRKIYVNE